MLETNEIFKNAVERTKNGKYKEAIEILSSLLKDFEKEEDKGGIIDILHQLSLNHFKLGNFRESDDYLERSLELVKSMDDKYRYSATLNLMASNLMRKGEYGRAMELLEETRVIKDQIQDQEGIGIVYSKMGSILMSQNKLEQAKEFINKSLEINQKLDNLQGVAINLSQLGSISQFQTQWDEAENYFKKSLSIKKQIKDIYGLGISYNQLGIIYQYKNKFDKAIKNYNESMEIKQAINDFVGIIKSFISLGDMELKSGNLKKAIEYFSKASELARQKNMKKDLCNALLGLAKILVEKNEINKVQPVAEEALQLSKELGDSDNEGQALLLLAKVISGKVLSNNYYEEAYKISVDHKLPLLEIDCLIFRASKFKKNQQIELLQTALRLSESIDEKQLQSIILREMGGTYRDMGDFEKALEYYEDSIKIAQGFQRIKAITDINILQMRKGQWDKIIDQLKKVYDTSIEGGQLSHAIQTLGYIGLLFQYKGEYKEAEKYYKQALDLNKNDIRKMAINLSNLGMLSLKTCNFDEALKFFLDSLKINMDHGNQYGIAVGLNQIGQVYQEKGQNEKALEYFQKSLQMKELIDDKIGASISLSTIGNLYLEMHNYEKALSYFQESLKIKEHLNEKYGIGRINGNIAKVYLEKGDYKRADSYQAKALNIARQLGDKESLIYGNYCQGVLEFKKDRLGKNALKFFEESLKIARETNDLMAQGMNLSKIAEINFANKNLAKSRDLYIESINIFDEVGLKIRRSSDRITLIQHFFPVFENLVSVLIDYWKTENKIEYLEEALGYTELGKSRELLSQITFKVPKNEEFIEYLNDLNSIKEKIFVMTAQFQEKIIEENEYKISLSNLKEKAMKLEQLIWEKFPEPRSVTPRDPRVILQRFLKNMKQYQMNWHVLEYMPNPDNSRLNIFSINKSRITVDSKEIDTTEYKNLNLKFNKILKSYYENDPKIVNDLINDLASQLSNLLIPQNVLKELENIDLLIVIPHGVLHNAPFELLIINGVQIGLTYPIARVLSLDILRSSIELRASISNEDVLIIGNPNKNETTNGDLVGLTNEYTIKLDLPFAENEANKITELLAKNKFKITALFSKDATKRAFLENSRNKSIIHFAGHSLFVGELPDLSFLLFSGPNGPEKFTASEIIANLTLDDSIIVLSACESGSTKILSGDEVFGLVRSLILAGGKSLILSIWPVFDVEATEDFMIALYQNLINHHHIAQSLYLARKSIQTKINGGIYGEDGKEMNLLLWGTFFIIGNPFSSLG